MRSTSRAICGRKSVRASASSSEISTVSSISLIAESGVRSSCETLATNSRRTCSIASNAVRSAATATAPPSNGCAVMPSVRSRAKSPIVMSRIDVSPAMAASTCRSIATDGTTAISACPTARSRLDVEELLGRLVHEPHDAARIDQKRGERERGEHALRAAVLVRSRRRRPRRRGVGSPPCPYALHRERYDDAGEDTGRAPQRARRAPAAIRGTCSRGCAP